MQHSPDLIFGINIFPHGAAYNMEHAFHLAQAISDWKLLNNESSPMIENARKNNVLIKGNLLKCILNCTTISFCHDSLGVDYSFSSFISCRDYNQHLV